MLLAIILIMPMINASTIYIGNTIYDNNQDRGRQITVLSNGTLCAIYLNAHYELKFNASFDDGATWVNKAQVVNNGSVIALSGLAVDSVDRLHAVYFNNTAAGKYSVCHVAYDWINNSWDINYKIMAVDVGGTTGLSIAIDTNDNVHCTWLYYTAPTSALWYMKYTKIMDAWSAAVQLAVFPDMYSCSLAVTNDNTVHCIFNNDGNYLAHIYLDQAVGTWSSVTSLSEYDAYNGIAAHGNALHVVSSRDGNIYYTKWSGSSWSTSIELYNNAYTQINPTISVNTDGDINVFWDGRTWETANTQILSRHYSDGAWGAIVVQTTGDYTKDCPMLLHQNIPSFCRLYDGFSGMYLDLINNLTYFDSGTLNWYIPGSDPSDGGIPACCLSCDTIGTYNTNGGTIQWNADSSIICFGTRHTIKEMGVLDRIDIAIGETMAKQILDAEWSTYSGVALKINTYFLGLYDELIQLGDTDKYIMSWIDCNITFVNEELYFMFAFFAQDPGVNCKLRLYATENDLNYDGWRFIGVYDQSYYTSAYGVWDSVYSTFDYFSSPFTYTNDMQMRLCMDRSTAPDPNEYENDLFVEPEIGCTNETYDITWFLNNTAILGANKYFTIEENGVERANYSIDTKSGHYGYIPISQGTYYVNLTVDGNLLGAVTFLINCNKDNFVYTKPNPSSIGQSFRIYYGYNYTVYSALLTVEETGKTWIILPNSSGYVSYLINDAGVYTITLEQYNNVTNQYIFVADNSEHLHSVESVTSNYITSYDSTNILIGDYFGIMGYHVHTNSYVYVKFGNKIIENVGSESEFDFAYAPTESGVFELTLILEKTDGTKITLATAGYIIVGSGDYIPPDDDNDDTINLIGDEYTVYFAILIIGIFSILPIVFASKFVVDVPPIIYIIFPLIGVGICVSLGILELWWILLMVVAMFAAAVYGLARR